MVSLYGTIERLCAQRGVNITQMCKEANISRGIISDYKIGRTKSLSSETLGKISDYFSVSLDYLHGKTDDPIPPQKKDAPGEGDGLSDLQREAMNAMLALDPADAEIVRNLAISLAKKHKQE